MSKATINYKQHQIHCSERYLMQLNGNRFREQDIHVINTWFDIRY